MQVLQLAGRTSGGREHEDIAAYAKGAALAKQNGCYVIECMWRLHSARLHAVLAECDQVAAAAAAVLVRDGRTSVASCIDATTDLSHSQNQGHCEALEALTAALEAAELFPFLTEGVLITLLPTVHKWLSPTISLRSGREQSCCTLRAHSSYCRYTLVCTTVVCIICKRMQEACAVISTSAAAQGARCQRMPRQSVLGLKCRMTQRRQRLPLLLMQSRDWRSLYTSV